MKASELQQESWTAFCEGIDQPSQKDWEFWREGFIHQREQRISPLMSPGNRFEQFSIVWIREMSLQAI